MSRKELRRSRRIEEQDQEAREQKRGEPVKILFNIG
jgi:hypothetical protein